MNNVMYELRHKTYCLGARVHGYDLELMTYGYSLGLRVYGLRLNA